MAKATKGFGSGAGVGGMIGGIGGATLGGLQNFSDAREQGMSIGQAAKAGLVGAGRGAAKGVAAGALAGGVGGAIAPGAASYLAKAPGLGVASRFGQRQVHSLTGVGDAAYVRSIGGGAAGAQKRLSEAEKALGSAKDTASQARATKELGDAKGAFEAAERSEGMGLTSIPGYLKSLVKDPKATLVAGTRDQWRSSSPAWRAAMYGLPAAGALNELRKTTDESGQQRGRFERAGRIAGGAASGMLAPLSLAGDVVAGGTISSGLGHLGRVADKMSRRPRPATTQEPGGGTTQAEGYVVSDRAAGTA